jgi:hypothetical protein
MKAFVGHALVSVLIFVAGIVFWTCGQLERRVTEIDKQLVTLKYSVPASAYDQIERSSRYLTWLPWIAKLGRHVRDQRPASEYWLSQYTSLRFPRDANDVVTETNPQTLFIDANAAYRSLRSQDGDKLTERQLDNVLGDYADVLKADPNNGDASFNYEFVARMRDSIARARAAKAAGKPKEAAAVQKPIINTIDGSQGSPPEDMSAAPFRTIVPKTGNERKEDQEAGKSSKKARKG